MSELLTNLDESEILTLMDDLNQQPPESVAQQPSEQTPVAQHPQTRLIILAVVLLAFLLSIIAYYFATTQTQPPPQNQLIPKPSPTPTQTTDQTVSTEGTQSANWKTYTNSKELYALKLPPTVRIEEFNEIDPKLPELVSSLYISLPSIPDIQSPQPNTIRAWKNLGIDVVDIASRNAWCNLLEKKLANTQLGCGPGSQDFPYAEVNVNGYKAFKPVASNLKKGYETFYIPHNNYVYQISLTNIKTEKEGNTYVTKDDPIPKQILSTLKFTPPAGEQQQQACPTPPACPAGKNLIHGEPGASSPSQCPLYQCL